MGYAPPKHINDPDEITKYYQAVIRVAPLHCFHCLEEDHLKPNCPLLKGPPTAQPSDGTPATQVVAPKQERANLSIAQGPPKAPPLTREEMNAVVKQQVEGMEQRMLEEVRKMLNPDNNANTNHNNQARAVRSSEDVNPEAEGTSLQTEAVNPEPGFLPQNSLNGQAEWPSYGRQDHLTILKLANKKQISLFECGCHQITKLECESNQSIIHLGIYVDYLRQKGHDIDRRILTKSFKAKTSVTVCLKDKERKAFGQVQIILKVGFFEIITTAWVVLEEDLIGQIFIGRNELSLRAVGPATGIRSAVIDKNAMMAVQVRGANGDPVDTGAGISLISADAW